MKHLVLILILVFGISSISIAQEFPNTATWTITDGGTGGTLDNMLKLSQLCSLINTEYTKPVKTPPLTNSNWCKKVFKRHIMKWAEDMKSHQSTTEIQALETKMNLIRSEQADSDVPF